MKEIIKGWRTIGTKVNTLGDCALIVATRNRPKQVRRLLDVCNKQPLGPSEIIIVDSSDDDDSEIAVKGWIGKVQPAFDLIFVRSSAGLTLQRNIGIELVTKDFIFFLDDDSVPQSGYFTAIRKLFLGDRERKIGAIAGTIINEIDRPIPLIWRLRMGLHLVSKGVSGQYFLTGTSLPRCMLKPFEGARNVDILPGCAMTFRHEVLENTKFSLFFEGYCQGEDLEMARRVARNWAIVESGDGRVIHEAVPFGRPIGFKRGYMVFINRQFIRKRHSRGIALQERLRFWTDMLFTLLFNLASFIKHPLEVRRLTYLAGFIVGGLRSLFFFNVPENEPPYVTHEFEIVQLPRGNVKSRSERVK